MKIYANLIKSMNQIIKTSEKRVGGRGEACKFGYIFLITIMFRCYGIGDLVACVCLVYCGNITERKLVMSAELHLQCSTIQKVDPST